MAIDLKNYEPALAYGAQISDSGEVATGNISATGTLAVTGASTLTGNVAAGGTLSVTGTTTLSGAVTQKAAVISGSGATVTLTAAQSGSTVLFDRAAGIVFTLPAPAVGMFFDFVVTTTITSNAAKVITDAGTTLLIGTLVGGVTTTATPFYGDGSTHISVSMNGTTTGGIKGTQFRLVCVSSTLWQASGLFQASGTIATPFATS